MQTFSDMVWEKQAGQEPSGRYILGDCRQGLQAMIKSGQKVRLVYMDPPFLTGKDFGAYDDRDSREQLLGLLREVLVLCKEMLQKDGSVFVHVDYRLSAHMRILLDEIFGEDCFANEIIWAYESGGRSTHHFSRKHDTILWYGSKPRPYFCPQAVAQIRSKVRKNHMKHGVDGDGRAYSSIVTNGKEYRYFDDELVPPSDVWSDISHLQQKDPSRTGYPTQKPLQLLERIVLAASSVGDTVLDPFCGSGTTLEAAHRWGRHGIGVDQSPLSQEIVHKRMAHVAMEYASL